jgi:hypothetical protein
MPITTLIAAANTIAPATSIRISIQDIAQPHAWKPQPAVRVGAHCRTLAAGKRDAANGEQQNVALRSARPHPQFGKVKRPAERRRRTDFCGPAPVEAGASAAAAAIGARGKSGPRIEQESGSRPTPQVAGSPLRLRAMLRSTVTAMTVLAVRWRRAELQTSLPPWFHGFVGGRDMLGARPISGLILAE